MTPLPHDFFQRPVAEVAAALIGVQIFVGGVGGTIVETEAYDHEDPASHSFAGRTARNAAMFGPPGRAYVYRSYGLHWCLNLVAGEHPGAAVLLRALQPEAGLERMQQRRGMRDTKLLCRGPGRLCQALGVTAALDGLALDAPPFALLARPGPVAVLAGPRIGISRGVATCWRFGLAGSAWLSRPLRSEAQP